MSHYKHQQVEISVPALLFRIMQLLELQSKQAAGGELPASSSLLHSAGVAGQNNQGPSGSTHVLSAMSGGDINQQHRKNGGNACLCLAIVELCCLLLRWAG